MLYVYQYLLWSKLEWIKWLHVSDTCTIRRWGLPLTESGLASDWFEQQSVKKWCYIGTRSHLAFRGLAALSPSPAAPSCCVRSWTTRLERLLTEREGLWDHMERWWGPGEVNLRTIFTKVPDMSEAILDPPEPIGLQVFWCSHPSPHHTEQKNHPAKPFPNLWPIKMGDVTKRSLFCIWSSSFGSSE